MKQKTDVKTKGAGKLSVIGQGDPSSENNYLRKKAKEAMTRQAEYEAANEFVKVPIHRGYLKVEKSKYKKNKAYYDSLKR